MHDAVSSLLAGDPAGERAWDAVWDALADRASAPDAVALLETLRDRPPAPRTVAALIASLDRRREHPEARAAVNIVGSGGGPATFNLSTAAAILAAAIGVPVIKSGSRGYTSRHGSLDMLKLLGIRAARSQEELEDQLARWGIAFAGPFVYPAELGLLARRAFPRDWRTLGAFVNRIGPFLAAVPADAQLTGVSDPALLELYAALPARRRLWLVGNRAGIDELVSFAGNEIPGAGRVRRRGPLGPGRLQDLAPSADAVGQFRALLGGEGPPAALDSIALNAAAMAVLGGVEPDWDVAFDEARTALAAGAAAALLDDVRACLASSSS
jgi:anthranilate phosphoribosyltransferase